MLKKIFFYDHCKLWFISITRPNFKQLEQAVQCTCRLHDTKGTVHHHMNTFFLEKCVKCKSHKTGKKYEHNSMNYENENIKNIYLLFHKSKFVTSHLNQIIFI